MKTFFICTFICLTLSSSLSVKEQLLGSEEFQTEKPPQLLVSNRVIENEGKNGWGGNGDHLHYGQPPRCLNAADVPATENWNPDFFSRSRFWYSSGGTAYGYNTYYRILNGRYASSQKQIDEMCPAAIFNTTSPLIVSGSGVQFTQICTEGQVSTCYMSKNPENFDDGVDVFAALGRQDIYIIRTDSKTYAIYYLCNDLKYGDIQLLTTRRHVSPEIYRIFLSYFKTFNILISQAQTSICSPPRFHASYPHPFETYPHSGGNGWRSNDR